MEAAQLTGARTRDIYRRITSYVKLQLTILSSVLQLMLLATVFNVNGGVALFPMQLLFCKFFVVVTVVIGFIADVPDPSVMQRPPRKPLIVVFAKAPVPGQVKTRLGLPPDRAADLHQALTLSFDEAFNGAQRTVTVTRRETCRTCAGSWVTRASTSTCFSSPTSAATVAVMVWNRTLSSRGTRSNLMGTPLQLG